jgi:hypothetical protein
MHWMSQALWTNLHLRMSYANGETVSPPCEPSRLTTVPSVAGRVRYLEVALWKTIVDSHTRTQKDYPILHRVRVYQDGAMMLPLSFRGLS